MGHRQGAGGQGWDTARGRAADAAGDDRPTDRWDDNGVSAGEAARGFRLAAD